MQPKAFMVDSLGHEIGVLGAGLLELRKRIAATQKQLETQAKRLDALRKRVDRQALKLSARP